MQFIVLKLLIQFQSGEVKWLQEIPVTMLQTQVRPLACQGLHVFSSQTQITLYVKDKA